MSWHHVCVPPPRYRLIQPDAPPPLRGSIYCSDGRTLCIGDLLPVQRQGRLVFWKVVAIEEDPDPTWTGIVRCGYAPEGEWPDVSPERQAARRPAVPEDFAPWHETDTPTP